MDEVDRAFDTPFRSDFFGMLRAWHNARAGNPLWKRLHIALVTSTEPYQFIANLTQSPFNVGTVVQLEDFSLTEMAELNRRHNSPLASTEEKHLYQLLNGHPYLTRRALYLVASGHLTPVTLFAQATSDDGPFGDHLYSQLRRLRSKPELSQGLRQVIRHHTCTDEEIFFRLHGAGLVRRQGRDVFPRCQLYADYFSERPDG
jgi:hypothetical protein